jgi:DNA-binding beta-propeller fold protein YncE
MSRLDFVCCAALAFGLSILGVAAESASAGGDTVVACCLPGGCMEITETLCGDLGGQDSGQSFCDAADSDGDGVTDACDDCPNDPAKIFPGECGCGSPDALVDLTYAGMFGSLGASNGQFLLPTGVAVDPAGRIYVADSTNHRVQVFNNAGGFLFTIGGPGAGNGQFNFPSTLTLDRAGRIYVVDQLNYRIQVFDYHGTFLFTFGSFGQSTGQFSRPQSVAVDATGRIFVTDPFNFRVQVFDNAGTFLFEFGEGGEVGGQFLQPLGIAVDDSAGLIYITDDGGGSRLRVFDTAGAFLFKIDTAPFSLPFGVAVDAAGRVYVTDALIDRILMFDQNGAPLFEIGTFGSDPGQFTNPYDVVVDATGRMYIADSGRHRIQIFDPLFECAGACCLPTGECVIVTPTSDFNANELCSLSGGVYQGHNVDCANAACAFPGACCLPDGGCVQAQMLDDDNDFCSLSGGIYQDNNVLCADVVCPDAGACCNLQFGTCTLTFADDCTGPLFSFQGDDTTCDAGLCPLAGACCLGDVCYVYTEQFCAAAGGCFRGEGTSCGAPASGTINLTVPTDGTSVSHTINIPNLGTVDGLRVFVDIDADDLSSMSIILHRGAEAIFLYDGECAAFTNDVLAVFADGGLPIASACSNVGIGLLSPPLYQPGEPLGVLDGTNIAGDWTLEIFGTDGAAPGNFRQWRIEFLNAQEVECIDCNLNGQEDSCETAPAYDPLLAGQRDLCADALPITNNVMYDGTTVGASSDTFLFCGPHISYFDVYYAYIPRSTGGAFLSVQDFGPEVFAISVHTDCPVTEGNRIACSAISAQGLAFNVVKGQNYIIRVAGLGTDVGQYFLTLTGPPALTNEVDDNADGEPDECECRADVTGDDIVDSADFIQVMNQQGLCPPADCPSDINLDGTVDTQDLMLIIENWGPCPFAAPPAPAMAPNSLKGVPLGDAAMEGRRTR